MVTNVYCDHCGKEVEHDDSFVIDSGETVRAYHFKCGTEIYNAMTEAMLKKMPGERS